MGAGAERGGGGGGGGGGGDPSDITRDTKNDVELGTDVDVEAEAEAEVDIDLDVNGDVDADLDEAGDFVDTYHESLAAPNKRHSIAIQISTNDGSRAC